MNSKDHSGYMAETFCAAGCAVVTIDYTIAPAGTRANADPLAFRNTVVLLRSF